MAPRLIRVEDLRGFQFVSDPRVSPDGRRIAFVLSRINIEKDAYERHVWMADASSGGVEQFTYGQGSDTYPRWSPDGRRLLFLSSGRDEEKKAKIYVIPASGGEARMAARSDEGVVNPQWAPDSRRILYSSKVWTEEKPETDVKVIRRIRYKANGSGTFEGRRVHLFTVRVGSKPKQLTSGEFDVDAAAWSPDGGTVAFVSNMEPDADISEVRDIYTIPAGGGGFVKVTDGRYAASEVSWSPDGKLIAFTGNDDPEGHAVDDNIWVMPSGGGEARNITGSLGKSLGQGIGSDLRVATPSPGHVWSRDGSSIMFLTASTPYSSVYRAGVDGGGVEEIVGGRTVDGFSASEDGSAIAFNAMDATHPAELYLRDALGERRLTRFNDKFLRQLKLSSPERFAFRNSEGAEIDGWIIRPPNLKEGEICPAVLEIHGGPRSIYGDGVFHEFQLLAAEGYAVIYTNPRGSAGYDEAYAKAVIGHYGEGDYDDLMRFTDEALRRFSFIDPDRLGVCGGSYGGYMTNWIVGHTSRFRAAVTFRSICNWISKYGTSDIGYMQPESIAGTEDYVGDIGGHLEKSPIMYVKNVKTPILIVHSEEDLRVPIEQGEQWFTALKLHGVETELVRFPGENHELSRSGKPKHREERLRHLVRWMNGHLNV
jgi:dipeptidyl aminopeptidase/acylaminoacyl peptidase